MQDSYTYDRIYSRVYGSSQSFVFAEKTKIEKESGRHQLNRANKRCQKTKTIDYNKTKSNRIRMTLCPQCREEEKLGRDSEDCEQRTDRKGRYRCPRLSDEKSCRVRLYLSADMTDEREMQIEEEARIKKEIALVVTNKPGINQNRILAQVHYSKRKVRKCLGWLVDDGNLNCVESTEKGICVKRYFLIKSISDPDPFELYLPDDPVSSWYDMKFSDLTDDQWEYARRFLPIQPRVGRKRTDDRRTINGIRYVLETGCRWSDMPRRYGSHVTAWRRLKRWSEEGVWDQIHRAIEIIAYSTFRANQLF
jgi:hypothetical protein